MRPCLLPLAALVLLPLGAAGPRPQGAPRAAQGLDERAPTLEEAEAAARALRAPDANTLVGERSLFTGYPAMHPDGTVTVVVENPAGTLERWRVDPEDGALKRAVEGGEPRVLRYLPYPADLGIVPRALRPGAAAGEAPRPLDALVIGPAVTRGAAVAARVVGVLRLERDGRPADVLLAVLAGSPLDRVRDLDELRDAWPGALEIVETWLVRHDPARKTAARGWGTDEDARATVRAAMTAWGEWTRAQKR